MNVRAIETAYKGCRFRSRLEARWAVFFDVLGEGWDYEKEGYHLPSGDYLPDFWLPRTERWAEIKGPAPTDREIRLVGELAIATGYPAMLLYGAPRLDQDGRFRSCLLAIPGIAAAFPSTLDEALPCVGWRQDCYLAGIEAARAARFEHGETPQVRSPPPFPRPAVTPGCSVYVAGMTVRHHAYGLGRVVEVSGNGLLRKVKIRFRTAGDRSFVADRVQLDVLDNAPA